MLENREDVVEKKKNGGHCSTLSPSSVFAVRLVFDLISLTASYNGIPSEQKKVKTEESMQRHRGASSSARETLMA